jgi:hypothetical protein
MNTIVLTNEKNSPTLVISVPNRADATNETLTRTLLLHYEKMYGFGNVHEVNLISIGSGQTDIEVIVNQPNEKPIRIIRHWSFFRTIGLSK